MSKHRASGGASSPPTLCHSQAQEFLCTSLLLMLFYNHKRKPRSDLKYVGIYVPVYVHINKAKEV